VGEAHVIVRLNGAAVEVAAGATIGTLVDGIVRDRSRVAVERNEEIVPRAAYDATAVQPGDVVEVVTVVGGG
jgi:thiamine biosynthesis protein ThiS